MIEEQDLLPLIAACKTLDEMSAALGVGRSAVRYAMRRFGLKSPNKRGRRPIDPEQEYAWEPVGLSYLDGLCFTDAKVPRNIGYRAPSQQQAESLIGCPTEMCSA